MIQLAKPNITPMDPAQRKLAWAVLSFVATVGGNLTITGSAGKPTRLTFKSTILMQYFVQLTSLLPKKFLAWIHNPPWTFLTIIECAFGSHCSAVLVVGQSLQVLPPFSTEQIV